MSAAATESRSATSASRREAPDRFDLLVLAGVAVISLAFIGFLLQRGGVLAGWEGYVVADQGQYLDWIRQSGEHVLIGNSFDLEPDTRVYFQPLLLASGVLHELGLPLGLAWLAWKPVAAAFLFLGAWLYVRRTVDGAWARRTALVLALFFVSPLAVASPLWGEAGRGTFNFISGEIWPVGQLWGYPFAALSVGLMPLLLLGAERAVREDSETWAPGRRGILLAIGAAVVAVCHPWQAATLMGVVVLAVVWHFRARPERAIPLARALWPLLAGALVPTAYLFGLSRLDASWQRNDDNYRTPLDFEATWRLFLAVGPLLVPAALAYRQPVSGLQDRMLRLWMPIAFAVYLIPSTPVRFHALNDVSIPMAVLAVRAVAPALRALPAERRRLAGAALAAACVLLIVPGTFDRLRSARSAVYLNLQPYHLDPGERDALDALEDARTPGGVLTTDHMGALVPKSTGRETYVGSPSWTPDFGERAAAAQSLLAGRLAPRQAVDLVRSSGARYVFADCRGRADLRQLLRPLLRDVRTYGCATVYELR